MYSNFRFSKERLYLSSARLWTYWKSKSRIIFIVVHGIRYWNIWLLKSILYFSKNDFQLLKVEVEGESWSTCDHVFVHRGMMTIIEKENTSSCSPQNLTFWKGFPNFSKIGVLLHCTLQNRWKLRYMWSCICVPDFEKDNGAFQWNGSQIWNAVHRPCTENIRPSRNTIEKYHCTFQGNDFQLLEVEVDWLGFKGSKIGVL